MGAVVEKKPIRKLKRKKPRIRVFVSGKAIGRPTLFTDECIQNLRHAFGIGCTDAQACAYAGVKDSAFYSFCAKNPDFAEERTRLKMEPVLKAKDTVFRNLNKIGTATWYLENKHPTEFNRSLKLIGDPDNPITVQRIERVIVEVNNNVNSANTYSEVE